MFDDETLKSLAGEYTLGYYVCDLDRFDQNYSEFLAAFSRYYPATQIAYSYKTNYLPALCRRVNTLGGYAEVVSGLEYQMAMAFGVSGDRIVFNGPLKTRENLLMAARQGSVVNLEGDYEIDHLEALRCEYPQLQHRVGLRCAVHLDAAAPSRFGFDIDQPDFQRRVERLQGMPGVRLVGLHCHSIPPGRSAENYALIAQRLVDLSRAIWGVKAPDYIDLGGGFFSNMTPGMCRQFATEIPSFSDYGAAITAPLLETFGPQARPELILEPGLALAADAVSFVCPVVDVKTVGERRLALAAGSVYNIRPTKSPRNLPMRRIKSGQRENPVLPPLDVVGYTCMEDDVLHRGFGASLAPGDLLVFDNAGAYTLVLKPPFIQGNVPVLAYRKGQDAVQVLKRAEVLDDLISTYRCDP